MTEDRIGKVLERVAWEQSAGTGHIKQQLLRVLESRLGPLLRAGEALADDQAEFFGGSRESLIVSDWDKALLAALEGEGADGK